MIQIELDFTQAKVNRDNAIKVCTLSADSKTPGWSDRAFEFVKRYALINRGQFMSEDIRKWAYSNGLERPENERAFGGVVVRASRAGIIKAVGYARTSNVLAHRTPATLWMAI
jgi:hypothetical protein